MGYLKVITGFGQPNASLRVLQEVNKQNKKQSGLSDIDTSLFSTYGKSWLPLGCPKPLIHHTALLGIGSAVAVAVASV